MKLFRGISVAVLFSQNWLVSATEEEGETIAVPSEGSSSDKEANVLQLTKANFQESLTENKFLLVKWYAPWCGHCKSMKVDYESAASKLKGMVEAKELDLKEGEKVALAEIDATVESELATQWEVQGYPTLHWFVNGHKKTDYTGPRTEEALLTFLKENAGPALKFVSEAELATMKSERKYGEGLVVFRGDGEELLTKATAVAEMPLIAANTVLVKAAGEATLEMFVGTKEVKSLPSPATTELELLKSAVNDSRRPIFGQINEDNFELYMENATEGLFWVCVDPTKIKSELEKHSDILVAAAEEQKKLGRSFPFVWLDISEFEEHAKQELGCTSYPTIVLQRGDLLGERGDSKVEKFVRSFAEDGQTLSQDAIKQFFDDVEKGTLEAVPEPDELDTLDEEDAAGEEGADGLDDDELGEGKEDL